MIHSVKRLPLFLLVGVILFSFFVSSYDNNYNEQCVTEIFEEDFQYSDDHFDETWTQQDNCCGTNAAPVQTGSPFEGYAFGDTLLTPSATGANRITKDILNEVLGRVINESVYFFSYNTSETSGTDAKETSEIYFGAIDQGVGTAWDGTLGVQFKDGSAQGIVHGSIPHLNSCFHTGDILIRPYTAEIAIEFDFRQSNNTYSIYVNGDCSGCCNVSFFRNGIGAFMVEQNWENGVQESKYVDDILFCEGSVSGILESPAQSIANCREPLLFCDTFSYTTDLSTRTWTVFGGGGGIIGLSPTNEELALNDSKYYNPLHGVSVHSTKYLTAEGVATVASFNAPKFTSEFQLEMKSYTADSVDECLGYDAFDANGREVYDLRFCPNGSIWYDSGSEFVQHCNACINTTNEMQVRIITSFTQRESFDFNSSILIDNVDIRINDSLTGQINSFINEEAVNTQRFSFTKFEDTEAVIDNYYVMVGEDKLTDTSPLFYTTFYDNNTQTGIVTAPGDFAQELDDIWETFGIRSLRSRLMAGLILLFIANLAIAGMFLSMGHTPNVAIQGFLTISLVIFLTFIRLLPIWIMFTTILLAVAIAGISIVFISKSS